MRRISGPTALVLVTVIVGLTCAAVFGAGVVAITAAGSLGAFATAIVGGFFPRKVETK